MLLTFCSWQASVTNHQRKLSERHSVPQAVSGTEGGGEPLYTSLLLKHEKKQQHFWLKRHLLDMKGGKIQRLSLQIFVASSFYSSRHLYPCSGFPHIEVYFTETMVHNIASRLHAKYHLEKMLWIQHRKEKQKEWSCANKSCAVILPQ